MILKRFYDEKLAQASYLIGCAGTGEACVIDANRDVEQYIKAAAEEGLTITHVTETHIHADFLSGSRELADRTGARLFLSAEGGPEWQYAFADQPNVMLIRDRDFFEVGNLRFDVLHTPGHTPEHVSFLLTDKPASKMPVGVFSGDFLFVGDVGRPDLLERAAGFEGTMVMGAQVLYKSLVKFLGEMPDHLLIWPAHGAGSPCGKSLGGVPVSVLGYEKDANWGLKLESEQAFVDAVLAGQPEPPSYFKQMKMRNKLGPAILDGFKMPARRGGDALLKMLDAGQIVVDVRSRGEVAMGVASGVINVPLGKGFTLYAGWLLPYDEPIALIANDEEQAREAVRDLQKIGLDHVVAWFGTETLDAIERSKRVLHGLPQISAEEARAMQAIGEAVWIDVRGINEFVAGHVPGARHIPLGYLEQTLSEVPKDRPIILQCGSGLRSTIAFTLLRRAGYLQPIYNLRGGFREYQESGLPIETGMLTPAVH